jgi:hypothetical protein
MKTSNLSERLLICKTLNLSLYLIGLFLYQKPYQIFSVIHHLCDEHIFYTYT